MRDTQYWNPDLETRPWDEVQAWQASRLPEWLRDLNGRSAFHREKLATTSIPAQLDTLSFLADVPFTTKAEVRGSQGGGGGDQPLGRHQGVPLEQIIQTLSSSGTTGDPLVWGLTANDLEVWCDSIATAFYTAGVRRHDVAAHLVGLPGVAGGLPYADGFRRIGATLAWLGGLPTERILRALPRVHATVVLATSSFGVYLAEECEKLIGTAAATLGIRNFLGGGEPGLAQREIRARVTEGWALDNVHEIMGLGDVLSVLWAECHIGGGMHFCGQQAVVVELIDPETGTLLPWEPGVRGEAVYTTLGREATPALRYRSSDHMEVTAVECACGRTSPRARCVGRTDDMLIYKAMNVFPNAIRDVVLDGWANEVQPYLAIWKDAPDQVRFDDPIPMDVEASNHLDVNRYDEIARRIEHEVRQRLQVRVSASVVSPGTLPRSQYKTALVHVREPQSSA